MLIYHTKDNPKHPFHHILDPDYTYQTMTQDALLYPYFKNLNKPSHIETLTGIYIEYEIPSHPYPMNIPLYQKTSPIILKMIEKHLDFSHAHLFDDQTHFFFITMFNVFEDRLMKALIDLSIDLKDQTHSQIRYGVYFSQPYIDPFEFFHCTKNQLKINAETHSLISCRYL